MGKIVNFDFQGWPVRAMSLKDILNAIGAEYNEETKKWEIDDDDQLNECITTLEDDGMGYGVQEHYIVAVGDYADKFTFFLDKELEHIDIWTQLKVYPDQIIKDDSENEWALVNIDKNDKDELVFQCCSNNDPMVRSIFTIDQVKKFTQQ